MFNIGGLDGVGPHGLVLETGQHLVAAFEPVLKRPRNFADFRLKTKEEKRLKLEKHEPISSTPQLPDVGIDFFVIEDLP